MFSPLLSLRQSMFSCLFVFMCVMGSMGTLFAQGPIYVSHWTSSSDPGLTSGTAGAVSTISLDTICSQVGISITDPVNAPLPPFNAYEVNPLDDMGNEITDLSGNMRIYVRARSADTVRLSMLLRSGGGSSAERSGRVEFTIPGGLTSWTELVFEYGPANLAGFDSTDFRDIWFYLDRGDDNFAGNEFYLDYVAIGEAPDSATFSTCTASPPNPSNDPLYSVHWSSNTDPIFTGNAAATLTQAIDTPCSQVAISVTDPANAPLDDFSALILNPQDTAGNDLVDLSGNLRFYVRARSKEPVMLGLLLRAGDGSSAFRSTLQEQVVPGDTAVWTDLTFTVDASNLGGFDSTDLRDVWLYLDRGTDNFAGNEFYLDYFSIGQAPDTSLNSTCATDSTGGNDTTIVGIQYTLHWATGADPLFSGSAAMALDQVADTLCSELAVSVTDPAGMPLGAFSALIINPLDSAGMDITDLSGSTDIHVRVRSRDSVMLGFLARAGDGTAPFRSSLQEQLVPGDTLNWTELTFSLDATTIGGFDSTDLRDLWFYLDRGTENFAGNEFYFDYVAIGEKPDPADDSPCSLLPPFEFPYLIHWADTTDGILTGSGAAQLTQTVDTACSQLSVSVTDPIGDPHAAFRPMIINPQDGLGNDLADLSDQMRFYVRVRSAGTVSLGMVLRSGDGQSNERSAIVEQTVPGDLTQWTELTYTFTGANLAGFDSTDLRDFWFYMDREEANFSGNEFYFDYVAIGSKPDAGSDSDCVETVGIASPLAIQNLSMYPNPSQGAQAIQLEFTAESAQEFSLRVFDIRGQLMLQESWEGRPGLTQRTIQPQQWAAGIYTIQVVGAKQASWIKWVID